MENVIVVLIIIFIVASIIWYLIRQKRKGVKCVGCPYAEQCSKDKIKCDGK